MVPVERCGGPHFLGGRLLAAGRGLQYEKYASVRCRVSGKTPPAVTRGALVLGVVGGLWFFPVAVIVAGWAWCLVGGGGWCCVRTG